MAGKLAAMKWHGGKQYLAPWIIGFFPPHRVRVETHGGGAAATLACGPEWIEGVAEVVNDLDGDLTNFWRVLADPELFSQMHRILQCVPFSEPEWRDAADRFRMATANPGIREANIGPQAAAEFFILCRQSMAGRMTSFAPLSKSRTRGGMGEQASAWLAAVDGLPAVHARMRRVQITNRDAVKLIHQMDSPETLFYCDPPYLMETRRAGRFRHEMTREQHIDLLVALSRIKGKFILSGYPSEVYRAAANQCGWWTAERVIDNKAASGDSKRLMVECLWMNFQPPAKGKSNGQPCEPAERPEAKVPEESTTEGIDHQAAGGLCEQKADDSRVAGGSV